MNVVRVGERTSRRGQQAVVVRRRRVRSLPDPPRRDVRPALPRLHLSTGSSTTGKGRSGSATRCTTCKEVTSSARRRAARTTSSRSTRSSRASTSRSRSPTAGVIGHQHESDDDSQGHPIPLLTAARGLPRRHARRCDRRVGRAVPAVSAGSPSTDRPNQEGPMCPDSLGERQRSTLAPWSVPSLSGGP